MARAPSFGTLLEKYREAFEARQFKASADREHLQAWADDPRAEKIWEKLTARNPVDANEFIALVLKARRNARALVARIEQSKDWRELWREHYAQAAAEISKSLVREQSLSDAADNLCDAADALARLSEEEREAAWVFDAMDELLLPSPLPPFGRQSTTKHVSTRDWRAVRLFILDLSAYWRERCGSWGDAEVTALTEIAFPSVGELENEAVRNIRRGSTR
jgi:hypothetical protein